MLALFLKSQLFLTTSHKLFNQEAAAKKMEDLNM